MIDLTGFRQTGGHGAPPPRTDPPFFQQRGRLPMPPPSQPLSPPTDLSMTGGGPSLQTRPPAIPYNRPRTDIPMGGPDPPGGIPMGTPQWPGMPRPYQAGMSQWSGMQNPYQRGMPPWMQQTQLPPWLMQRQPYQMGQPQWPGMQRPPWMQQQGGPGRY